MQIVIEKCSQCDCGQKRPIVNKKYFLCDEKNYQRLHGGETKQDVYAKRTTQVAANNSKYITRTTVQQSIPELKKKYSIKQISDKNNYSCSDGTVVNQVIVNRKYAEAIDQIKNERDQVCQGQRRGDVPLSFSHTISRKRCKELGKAELIWDKDNLEVEGFHEPSSKPEYAHNIWETGSVDQKVQLLNFSRKLVYIQKHDPESYRKWRRELIDHGYDINNFS